MENYPDVVRLKGYVSVVEAAKQCKCSRHTIYRRIRLGQLRAVQTGGTLSVKQSEVDKWLRKKAS